MHDKENKHLLLLLLFSIAALLLHLAHLFADIDHPLFVNLMEKVAQTGLFDFFHKPQLIARIKTIHSVSLIFVGCALYFGAYLALAIPGKLGMQIYIGTLTFGYLILLAGLLYIRRIISNSLLDDQFNTKNKLFKQEKKMIANPSRAR